MRPRLSSKVFYFFIFLHVVALAKVPQKFLRHGESFIEKGWKVSHHVSHPEEGMRGTKVVSQSARTERESRLIAGRLFSGFGDAGREHTKVLSESDICHVTSQVPMLMPDQALFVLVAVAVAVRFSPLFIFFKLCRDARLIMSPSPFICPAVLYTAI